MPEQSTASRWPRGRASQDELLRAIETKLPELGLSLRRIAENVLGLDEHIDLVLLGPQGRVSILLVDRDQDDLSLVANALAQRAWLAARLPDWQQLAPDLALDPQAPVRALLLAPRFSNQALAALRAADPEGIDAICFRALPNQEVLLDPCWLGGAPAPASGQTQNTPQGARFRTGLTDADLSVTRQERRLLE